MNTIYGFYRNAKSFLIILLTSEVSVKKERSMGNMKPIIDAHRKIDFL